MKGGCFVDAASYLGGNQIRGRAIHGIHYYGFGPYEAL